MRNFIFIFICVLAILFLMLFLPRSVRHVRVSQYDEDKLHVIELAFLLYEDKYGDLPTESNFRDLLWANEFVLNKNSLYSGDTDILIRYFRHGSNYVLVSPVKNKKFDMPVV